MTKMVFKLLLWLMRAKRLRWTGLPRWAFESMPVPKEMPGWGMPVPTERVGWWVFKWTRPLRWATTQEMADAWGCTKDEAKTLLRGMCRRRRNWRQLVMRRFRTESSGWLTVWRVLP